MSGPGASPPDPVGSDGGESEERVRRFLRERGVPADEIERASEQHRLHLLVVDAVLTPDEVRYTPLDVADLSGVPIELLDRFWRALGFPNAPRDEPAFGTVDLEAVSTLTGLLALRLSEPEPALQLARVIGSAMSRIADAEISAAPALRNPSDSAEMAERFILTADATLPGMSRLLDYAWRRHLRAAARRAMIVTGFESGGGQARLTVGFADLVGFTVLSQQMTEMELAEMVGRFEATAYDTVTDLGGRVVKMIGDEVMYVAEDVRVGAEVALSLAEAYAGDEILSEVRGGLACGTVVVRDGDYYGPVVNMASRMVNIAAPGAVLVSDEVHEALSAAPDLEWRSLRPRFLKDIGRVHMWRVSRLGGTPGRAEKRLSARTQLGARLGPERRP